IDTIARRGDGPQVALKAAFEEMTALRRRYADRIVFAPSLSHSLMLGLIADFFDAVFADEGASVCGRFAHDGSAVLVDLGLAYRYAGYLDLQSAAFFEAVVEAVENPERGEAVKAEDW